MTASTYGDQVYQDLLPLFEKSHCTHYKSDFHEIDRKVLARDVVPGTEYVWAVRECGTHLMAAGLPRDDEELEALKNVGKVLYYHVRCIAAGRTTIRELANRDAAASVFRSPRVMLPIATGQYVTVNGISHTCYAIRDVRSVHIAQVDIATQFLRDTNRQVVDLRFSIAPGLAADMQFLCIRAASRAASRQAGTLFWSHRHFFINDRDGVDHLAELVQIKQSRTASIEPVGLF